MSEIIGVNKIIEKSVIIDGIKVKEMSVLHFLYYLEKKYDLEDLNNIENVIDLVHECTGQRIELTDDTIEKLLLYYHSILNMLVNKSDEKESDYVYTLDYSFFIAKVMKWYSYKLEEVYKLPYSVFSTLLNHVSVFEAEEDLRMSRVVDNQLNLKSENTKSYYTEFKNSLNDKIKNVVKCTKTAKAQLRDWRRFHGIKDIKKELEKGV